MASPNRVRALLGVPPRSPREQGALHTNGCAVLNRRLQFGRVHVTLTLLYGRLRRAERGDGRHDVARNGTIPGEAGIDPEETATSVHLLLRWSVDSCFAPAAITSFRQVHSKTGLARVH